MHSILRQLRSATAKAVVTRAPALTLALGGTARAASAPPVATIVTKTAKPYATHEKSPWEGTYIARITTPCPDALGDVGWDTGTGIVQRSYSLLKISFYHLRLRLRMRMEHD